MKSLMQLWQVMADELAILCHTSATRDGQTVARRTNMEGDSFLTITLPSFAKEFERALELGKVDPTLFTGFRKRSGLPLFLGGFLDQVFDRGTGLLLDVPNIDCIFAIRQLTMLCGKILRPCSDARTRGAMRKYVECEHDVECADAQLSDRLRKEFEDMSALIFGDVFQEMDNLVYQNLVGDTILSERRFIELRQQGGAPSESILRPKHGPGATADGLKGNQKFVQRYWPIRLDAVFPYGEYAIPNGRYYYLQDHVDIVEPEMERPVKVISVPKTLKTPRIIAIEPTCMQYMQQALLAPLIQKLESKFINSGSKGQVNLAHSLVGFSEQDPNRDLARIGSRKGNLATLDMSEASDRVSNLHVKHLVSRWPWFSQAVQATRSLKADVPGQGVISLSKFASMGSALCFPMEAMVFVTVIFLALQSKHSNLFTRKDVLSYRGKVRVYGDDIIVPVDCVNTVIEYLEAFGLKVNTGKSYWNGKFRESCGGDYYDGVQVTPARVRRDLPASRKDVQGIISTVSLRNQLYELGLWQSAKWLDDRIVRVLPHYPIVEPSSSLLGRNSVSFRPNGDRWDCNKQVPVTLGYSVKSTLPKSKASGEGALLKFFLKRGDEPIHDERHLERSGRPLRVDIKRSWRPAW